MPIRALEMCVIFPMQRDRPIQSEQFLTDTLADSYVLKTSEVSGFAAEMACKRKHSKYRNKTTQ
jgi:hypothetical protein